MRTDVKLGLVLSLVVVVVAGLYFMGRGGKDESVPMSGDQGASSKDVADAGGKAPAKPAVKERARPAPRRTGPSVDGRSPARDAVRQPARQPLRSPSSPQAGAQPDRSRSDRPREVAPPRQEQPPTADVNPSRDRLLSDILGKKDEDPGRADQPAPREGQPAESGTRAATEGPVEVPEATTSTRQPDSLKLNALRPTDSAQPEQPAAPRRGETHIVQEGETIATLAEIYYGDRSRADLLLQANPQVTDPSRLAVGTRLTIPSLDTAPVPTGPGVPTSPEKVTPASPTPPSPAPGTEKTYTVQAGDSFYKIAQRVLGDGNRWPEIFALNKDVVGSKPDRLQVGQVIKLPAAAAAARAAETTPRRR